MDADSLVDEAGSGAHAGTGAFRDRQNGADRDSAPAGGGRVPLATAEATSLAEAVKLALSFAYEIADDIFTMGWTFAITRPPNWFITSDNPFCMLDYSNSPPYAQVGMRSLKSPGVEIDLPYSGTSPLSPIGGVPAQGGGSMRRCG